MGLVYSHSYKDPESGDHIDVMVDDGEGDDDGDASEHRNARPDRRRPKRRGVPARGRKTLPRPRPGSQRGRPVIRPHRPAPADDGYFQLKKESLVEVIPLAGKVWSSFLGRPEMPTPTGDHITDRENAALHRDALAKHQQAQHRIEALSEIAAATLDMIMN